MYFLVHIRPAKPKTISKSRPFIFQSAMTAALPTGLTGATMTMNAANWGDIVFRHSRVSRSSKESTIQERLIVRVICLRTQTLLLRNPLLAKS